MASTTDIAQSLCSLVPRPSVGEKGKRKEKIPFPPTKCLRTRLSFCVDVYMIYIAT